MTRLLGILAPRIDQIAIIAGACIIVGVAFTFAIVAGFAVLGIALVLLGSFGR